MCECLCVCVSVQPAVKIDGLSLRKYSTFIWSLKLFLYFSFTHLMRSHSKELSLKANIVKKLNSISLLLLWWSQCVCVADLKMFIFLIRISLICDERQWIRTDILCKSTMWMCHLPASDQMNCTNTALWPIKNNHFVWWRRQPNLRLKYTYE